MDTEIRDFPTNSAGVYPAVGLNNNLAMDQSSRSLIDNIYKPMYLVPPVPTVKCHYEQILRNRSFDSRFEI